LYYDNIAESCDDFSEIIDDEVEKMMRKYNKAKTTSARHFPFGSD
jgi:hypothetical protein